MPSWILWGLAETNWHQLLIDDDPMPSRVQANPASDPGVLSEAPTFLHNHVLMVVQQHSAIVHVQHAQRLGLHRGTAGGGDSVGLVTLQQTLKRRTGGSVPIPECKK